MSVVKKAAKGSLFLLSLFVMLIVAGGIYLYVNMGSMAKQMSEKAASDALGVAVSIGDMDISLEDMKVVVSDIKIANPPGYKKDNAITIKAITVAAQGFSKELLTFALVSVDGTDVFVEVKPDGTNLGDIKKNTERYTQASSGEKKSHNAKAPKVIIQKFSMTKAQLMPSVLLIDKDLGKVVVPDVHLYGIGQKENGVVAQEAVAQIAAAVLDQFNKSANRAGFLNGLSLDVLNDIGVSTLDVFKKNLKESYDKDVQQLKDGIDSLKGIFE